MPAAQRLQLIGLVLLAACVGCTTPPPTAYVNATGGSGKPAAQEAIGKNAVGEACTMQETGETSADLYCGTWQQPSARLRGGEAASPDTLASIAANSSWRAALDQRFACQAPETTTILDARPAQLLQCTQRVGGWPHVGVVALIGGRAWYGDGVLPAATVMERAIGVRAGLIKPDAVMASSGADALLAQRLAAQSVSSGDIGQFNTLMAAGTRANLSDNPAAAEAAFRAALTLQQKALGKDNPNTATAVMTLALELSDDGRLAEATSLFAQAERLAPGAADPIEQARLLHYRALDAMNRSQFDTAATLLQSAIAAYSALVPPSALVRRAATRSSAFGGGLVSDQEIITDPSAQGALVGLIEAKRNQALVLRQLGRLDESQAALATATDIAEANRLLRPIVEARLYLASGVAASAAGNSSMALNDLALSARAFDRALPEIQAAGRYAAAARRRTGTRRTSRSGLGAVPLGCHLARRAEVEYQRRGNRAVPGCLCGRRFRRCRAAPGAAGRDVYRRPARTGRHHQPADCPGHRAIAGERARPEGRGGDPPAGGCQFQAAGALYTA